MHRLETLFIGRNVHDLPSIRSTNEYALSLLSKSNPAEGTVISTSKQYAGRGQIGSSWESEPGKNITLSVILYPEMLLATQQFLLNQVISLAMFDLLEKHCPGKTKVKWPNDIYLHSKKVAGILIQNSILGFRLRHSVVGIGLNVNQDVFSSAASNPTSIKLENGMDTPLPLIASQLFHCIESWYLKLRAGNTVLLREAYLRRLYRYEEQSHFVRSNGDVFEGRITGVEESGKLEVDVLGTKELFGLKEIKFI